MINKEVYTNPKRTKTPPLKDINTVYLRDIRDLTLHGGISNYSELVILPIFSGLGTKHIKTKEYLEQSKKIWKKGNLKTILEEFKQLKSPTKYQMYFPALTAVLPLPNPSVIDHILAEETPSTTLNTQAKKQIKNCINHPKWSEFTNYGKEIEDDLNTINNLLDIETNSPGTLTTIFREVLTAIKDLHAAIDEAEESKDFVILSCRELHRAVNKIHIDDTKGENLKIWSKFFKEITEDNSTLSAALAQNKNKFNVSHISEEFAENNSIWAILPNISAKTLINFANTIESAQKRATISTGESPEKHTRHEINRASNIAKPRSTPLRTNLRLAWRIMTKRAAQASFYGSKWQISELSQAWSQRFSPESAFAVLADQLPSRPISEGGALLAKREVNTTETNSQEKSFVRIEPAVPKPHVAAIRPQTRLKKFPSANQRYQTLNAAIQENNTVSSLYIDQQEKLIWPHGRIWQAVDLIKTLASHPKLFLNPEALATGFAKVPYEVWELPRPELTEVGLSWNQVHDWILGAVPWSSVPTPCPSRGQRVEYYNEEDDDEWPVCSVDGGLFAADTRIGVQFVASDESKIGDAKSFAQLLAEFSKAAKDKNKSLDDLLSGLESGLRFKPKPFFEVEGRTVEEEEWFNATKTKAGYYRLSCGRVIAPEVYTAKTDQFVLRQRVYAKYNNLRLGDLWPVQQEALGKSTKDLTPEEYIKQLHIKIAPVLKQLDEVAVKQVEKRLLKGPVKKLAKTLRPHQTAGLVWAYIRFHLGFGVCIADEMGLGKTLQAIALMKALPGDTPSIVVMPKTLLHNWKRELSTFAKDIRVAIHGEEEDLEDEFDVLLVTYPRLRGDQEYLTSRDWHFAVLDEAQAIKNSDTQISQAANLLEARYRMALTGTPIENRASELWSIINWLNPGYLGKQSEFTTYTSVARSSEQKVVLLQPLRESLDPIIIRRLKSDPKINLGLPDKVFLDVGCELSEEQVALYESVLETVLAEEDVNLKGFKRRAVFLKAILHLKQICLHPDLFYGEQDEEEITENIDVATRKTANKIRKAVISRLRKGKKSSSKKKSWLSRSSKLSTAADLIEELRVQSRGILVFTQYLGAAELLRKALGQQEEIPFIHGGLSASARLELVDEFNESCYQKRNGKGCPIMILSLKSGGTGLNLVGADRVIHFDRWWNPAVEDQATDRAHRIGQDNSVFIHTITCQGTIEESIARLFVDKRQLLDDLLGAAASDDVGSQLRSRDGFLSLVDPQGIFRNRLTVEQQH